ncbi:hypothetical protein ACH5RR_018242 [Cinchona calisaya]|uniref:Uncharacterized protein n=1 Tax=Cinchona calisaya TaxID=153742 RepID=A0ABD2ZLC0_9GENT
MPSGSKKRKAAKKKKEQDSSSHNQNHIQQPESAVSHTHENDDLKHHDDKESEGEEVSSPALQDHPTHQHEFADGEKEDVEKVKESSFVQLSNEESKSIEEFKDNVGAVEEAVVDESVVQIEKEPKLASELIGKNIIEEHVEARKDSGGGVVSQSVDEESPVEIGRELKVFEKLDVSVEHDDPRKESTSDAVLPESHNDEYHVIDKTNVVVDYSLFGSSAEAVNSFSEGLTQVPNPVPVGEVYASIVVSGSDTVEDKVGLAIEKFNIDSSSQGNSLSTSNAVVPGLEENEQKDAVVLNQLDRSLTPVVDLGLENKSDEAMAVASDASRASDVKNALTKETQEKFLLPYNVSKNEDCENASNGSDCIKYSEVHESSDTRPLVASATGPVQRTSWISCCGLFEVLAGSSR